MHKPVRFVTTSWTFAYENSALLEKAAGQLYILCYNSSISSMRMKAIAC